MHPRTRNAILWAGSLPTMAFPGPERALAAIVFIQSRDRVIHRKFAPVRPPMAALRLFNHFHGVSTTYADAHPTVRRGVILSGAVFQAKRRIFRADQRPRPEKFSREPSLGSTAPSSGRRLRERAQRY